MIITKQVSVATSATPLVTVPPGVTTVVISNPQSANNVYVGTGSGVTASNGGQLPGNSSISLPGYPGSSGTTLYAIANVTTTISVFLSTAS